MWGQYWKVVILTRGRHIGTILESSDTHQYWQVVIITREIYMEAIPVSGNIHKREAQNGGQYW